MSKAHGANRRTIITKSVKSSRFVIHSWTRGCRELYGAIGIYSVYDAESKLCLYIGQSIDLGKRVRRFFKDTFGRSSKKAYFIQRSGERSVFHTVFLEITTIDNAHHLDKFERTMIGIKKPVYNLLLNYTRTSSASVSLDSSLQELK